jgi:hypothetical protein
MTVADAQDLVDAGDHWIVPVGEGLIAQVAVDFAFSLMIHPDMVVRIEGPFRAVSPDSSVANYVPNEKWSALGPLLALHQLNVTTMLVSKAGTLTIEIAGGPTLIVDAGPHYEAFTITRGRNDRGFGWFMLVGTPGGGVTRF